MALVEHKDAIPLNPLCDESIHDEFLVGVFLRRGVFGHPGCQPLHEYIATHAVTGIAEFGHQRGRTTTTRCRRRRRRAGGRG